MKDEKKSQFNLSLANFIFVVAFDPILMRNPKRLRVRKRWSDRERERARKREREQEKVDEREK